MSSIAMPPDSASRGDPAATGASLHWKALEGLYASAPINGKFRSRLDILGEGLSRITFDVEHDCFHSAGAAHGTIYFKMLDDAAFYAANTLITYRSLQPTSFNTRLTQPHRRGTTLDKE